MTKKIIILGQGADAKTLAQQCVIHSVVGQSEQLVCDECGDTGRTYPTLAEPDGVECEKCKALCQFGVMPSLPDGLEDYIIDLENETQQLRIYDVSGSLLKSLHQDLKGFQEMGFLTPDAKSGLGIAIEQVERYMRGDLEARQQ